MVGNVWIAVTCGAHVDPFGIPQCQYVRIVGRKDEPPSRFAPAQLLDLLIRHKRVVRAEANAKSLCTAGLSKGVRLIGIAVICDQTLIPDQFDRPCLFLPTCEIVPEVILVGSSSSRVV